MAFSYSTQFTATQKSLYANGRGTFVNTNPLANVTIMGVAEGVQNVSLNGQALESGMWNYDEKSQVLGVMGLEEMTAMGAWMSDWVMTWG